MKNIKIPCLSTVWATGTFTQNNSKREWIDKGRKRAVNPHPFYRQTMVDVNFATMEDKRYAEISVYALLDGDPRNPVSILLDEDYNFYQKEAVDLTEPKYNAIFAARTISPAHSERCTMPNIPKFVADIDELSANGVIIDETIYPLQEYTNDWVYHADSFWKKIPEPILYRHMGNTPMMSAESTFHLWDSAEHTVYQKREESEDYFRKWIRAIASGNFSGLEDDFKASSVFNNHPDVHFVDGDESLMSVSDNRDIGGIVMRAFIITSSLREFEEKIRQDIPPVNELALAPGRRP